MASSAQLMLTTNWLGGNHINELVPSVSIQTNQRGKKWGASFSLADTNNYIYQISTIIHATYYELIMNRSATAVMISPQMLFFSVSTKYSCLLLYTTDKIVQTVTISLTITTISTPCSSCSSSYSLQSYR